MRPDTAASGGIARGGARSSGQQICPGDGAPIGAAHHRGCDFLHVREERGVDFVFNDMKTRLGGLDSSLGRGSEAGCPTRPHFSTVKPKFVNDFYGRWIRWRPPLPTPRKSAQQFAVDYKASSSRRKKRRRMRKKKGTRRAPQDRKLLLADQQIKRKVKALESTVAELRTMVAAEAATLKQSTNCAVHVKVVSVPPEETARRVAAVVAELSHNWAIRERALLAQLKAKQELVTRHQALARQAESKAKAAAQVQAQIADTVKTSVNSGLHAQAQQHDLMFKYAVNEAADEKAKLLQEIAQIRKKLDSRSMLKTCKIETELQRSVRELQDFIADLCSKC